MSEWVRWHEMYDEGGPLARRLEVVQDMIRSALDASAPGPIRVISMCAGDGRDLLGVLEDHPRCVDVHARLVELDPELAARASGYAATIGPGIEVVNGDASTTSAYTGAVPADILLVCGVFGNIADEDVRNTIELLPTLCAPGATVVWTRGRFASDLTPVIREWFTANGFVELAFVAIPDTIASVGADRLTAAPQAFVPDVTLFTFLSTRQRPSQRGIAL